MIGAVLTDAVRGTWIERMNKSVSIPDEPSALPLAVKRRAGRRFSRPFLSAVSR